MIKNEEVESPRKRKASKLRARLKTAAREPNTKKWQLTHAAVGRFYCRRFKRANKIQEWEPSIGLQPQFLSP